MSVSDVVPLHLLPVLESDPVLQVIIVFIISSSLNNYFLQEVLIKNYSYILGGSGRGLIT